MMAFPMICFKLLALLQISLVSSYNTDEANECFKCSIDDKKCGTDKVECDFTNNECIVYQLLKETSTVTIKDCATKNHCAQLKSNEKSLIMCNECNTTNCNEQITEKSCIQCDSGNKDEEWCDDIINTDKNTASSCPLDETMKPECVTYRYSKGGQYFTYRGCASKDFCKNPSSDVTWCQSCSEDKCNKNLIPPLCIKCNSLTNGECAKDDMNSKKIEDYCSLDDDSMECVAQKYLDVNSDTMVTSRSCESKDFCEKDSKPNTVCKQCKETDCNKKIDLKKETPLCVLCEGQEGTSACAAENVDLKQMEFCNINAANEECFAYKFLKDGKSFTKRGCSSKDSCKDLENNQTNILSCNSCSQGNICNRNLSLTDEKTLCIQCSSTDEGYCSADDMNLSKVKEYCSSDNATNCIAYKYLDVATKDMVTYRGCAPKNYCEEGLSSNATVCNECNETVCNKRIDQRKESILCAVCTGEEGSDCDAGLDFSEQMSFCRLVDDEECFANKYMSGYKLITQRGCAQKDFCTTATSNSTICKSCSDYNNCNLDLPLTDEATLCVQCTSEDDPECAKDDMNSAKVQKYCHLMDDSSKCVAYKFLNGLTGNMSAYRGCASAGYCQDTTLSNNMTICKECSGNICNKKMDTSKELTLCLQCRGQGCDKESMNLSETKFCGIDSEEKECVAYTTLEGNKTTTVRDCEPRGYCEDIATSSETKSCKSCTNSTICNSDLDLKDEKVLCVRCTSENDQNCASDVMDATKIKTHCKLDNDKNECIVYKYLDMKTKKKITIRDCVAKEEDACANLGISKNNTTLEHCFECTSDICNLNLMPTTTTTSTTTTTTQSPGGGASSVTNLGTGFLILLASVLIWA